MFVTVARRLKDYLTREDGAVTVDFVVLVALVVGLTLSIFAVLLQPMQPGAENLGTVIEDEGIQTTFN